MSTTAYSNALGPVAPRPPTGDVARVLHAYGTRALSATVTYQELDGLQVAGFTCYRGRQYLTDRNQPGQAAVAFNDKTGILDPTNIASPLWPPGPVPGSPMQLQLLNPTTGDYVTVFTGLTQNLPQTVWDQQASFNRGTIGLVDLFSLLARKEVPPGLDFNAPGAPPVSNVSGDTTYAAQTVQDRLLAILQDAGVPAGLVNIFSGNVYVLPTVYSPGAFILSALQDAADAEFPGVSNLYVDKHGVIQFKGRLARFIGGSGPPYYVNSWTVADIPFGSSLSPSYALVSAQDMTIDMAIDHIYNAALFTPKNMLVVDTAGQLVTHSASLNYYGPLPITGQQLIVAGQTAGALSPASYAHGLATAKMFAQWYVNGFNGWDNLNNRPKPPVNVRQLRLRPVRVSAPNASYHWNMVCNVELGDIVYLNITTPHGGGIAGGTPGVPEDPAGQFFVEGIRYDLALGGTVPNVTVTLDLSPRAPYLVTPPANWNPGG